MQLTNLNCFQLWGKNLKFLPENPWHRDFFHLGGERVKEIWVRLSPRQVQRQAAGAAARQTLAVSEEVHGEVSFEATGWHGVSCCPEVQHHIVDISDGQISNPNLSLKSQIF